MVQTDLFEKIKSANLANAEEKIWKYEGEIEYLILALKFPTDFFKWMRRSFAEAMRSIGDENG